MRQPRIPPGDRRAVGWRTWLLSRSAGMVMGTEPFKLFLTLGRHRSLFHGWITFSRRFLIGSRLPRRDVELVILRVAHLRACRYELEHHVRLSRRAGVSEEDRDRVAAGPRAEGWSPRERALLRAVDEMHERRDVSDDTWSTLREHLDEAELIELVLLAAHYEMLATTIATLGIAPDAPRPGRLRGWLATARERWERWEERWPWGPQVGHRGLGARRRRTPPVGRERRIDSVGRLGRGAPDEAERGDVPDPPGERFTAGD